ncbi:hypothetical protein CH372_17295 [Leptospira meyeri]|uniref:hypothetical protein n=1 Tax=Leptospira meyeri TaxID=29508 RepID=UPI000C2A03DD|nr:hypothetical protein [Leptospira meyeri]PKA10838.1 hypothetical protein CH372_17295 [Leptospira meyeri]PKA23958.1 hypothetical protein CH381_23155 [Leptospira sp. mixed culture ATI2-C-A1]
MNIESFKKRFHDVFDVLSPEDLRSDFKKLGYHFIEDDFIIMKEFIQDKDYYIKTIPVNKVNFDKVIFDDDQNDMLLSA